MKNLIYIIIICLFSYSCNTGKKAIEQTDEITTKEQDTVRIANEELEYEIIIIEPGFNTWVASTARPRGYYELSYLENRNNIMVREWNLRVIQPQRYNPNLYMLQINYDQNIDYGYEVNYLLYNYFIYFQLKHNQRLSSFTPRI